MSGGTLLAEKFVMVPHEMYKDFFGNSNGLDSSETYRDVILNSRTLKGDTKVKLLSASKRTPNADTSLLNGLKSSKKDESSLSDSSLALLDKTESSQLNNESSGSLRLDGTTGYTSGVRDSVTTNKPLLGAAGRSLNRPGLKESYNKIFQTLDSRLKFDRRKQNARHIFEILVKSPRITIDPHTLRFLVDGSVSNAIDAGQFLYDMQIYNKGIPDSYKALLKAVDIPHSLIANIRAEKIKLLPPTPSFDNNKRTPVLRRMGDPAIVETEMAEIPMTPLQSTANRAGRKVSFDTFLSAQGAVGGVLDEGQDFTPRKMLRVSDGGDETEEAAQDQWNYTFE